MFLISLRIGRQALQSWRVARGWGAQKSVRLPSSDVHQWVQTFLFGLGAGKFRRPRKLVGESAHVLTRGEAARVPLSAKYLLRPPKTLEIVDKWVRPDPLTPCESSQACALYLQQR